MKDYVGTEAFLMLLAFLQMGAAGSGFLEDISEEMDTMDVSQLMRLIERASARVEQLRSKAKTQVEETVLKIDASYRIFIAGRPDTEILLRPIPKTIFILFLKHPEGIILRDLPKYREELFGIYGTISPRLDAEGMRRSIDLLLNPSSNSFREQNSRLSRALACIFDEKVLPDILISGARAGVKSISMDRTFVEWGYNSDLE